MIIKGVKRAADYFGIPKPTFERHAACNTFPSTKVGKLREFNSVDVHKWLLEHELNKTKPNRDNMDAARLRLEQLKADKLEIEIKKEYSQLIDANALSNILQSAFISTVDSLDSLVGKLRRECPHLEHRDFEIIESTIAKARNELSEEIPAALAKGAK